MRHEVMNWNHFPVFPDLFDDWSADFFNDHHFMKTDIMTKDGNYIMKVEVPGFEKDDIQVELKDEYLYINAEKHQNKEEKDEKGTIIRQERCGDHCSRSFYVGSDYKQEDFKASYKNGELTITFPERKENEAQTKQIEIH